MATAKVKRAITFEHADGLLTFKSSNGDSFTLSLAGLSDDARAQAVVFGVARKVTNATALDAGATVAEKWTELVAVAERLHGGGSWNEAGREKGAGGDAGLVVLAFARVYGDSREKAEATIARTMEKRGMSRKAALALWAGSDKVAKAIADIKAERAARAAAGAAVDADALMADMMAD